MSFFTDRQMDVIMRTEQAGRDEEDSIDAARESMRERCAQIALSEKVDFEATGDPADEAYNAACEHIAAAIRASK